MRNLFAKCLSALLIACLLLSPVAVMEGTGTFEEAVEEISVVSAKEESSEMVYDIGEIATVEEDVKSDVAVANAPSEVNTVEEVAESVPDEETGPVSTSEDRDEPEAEVVPDAVDEGVEEQLVDLTDDSTLCLPQTVEELDLDSLEEISTNELSLMMFEGANGSLFAASGDVEINATVFPDEAFRNYILLDIDKDRNGILSEKERLNVTKINVQNKQIKDLTGIKLFPSVTTIDCRWNQLTALDVSNCEKLKELYIDDNQLATLNAIGCKELEILEANDNSLTLMEIDGCINLKGIYCYGSQLKSFEIKNYPKLETVSFDHCQLTSLYVANCANLIRISCSANQLTTLDIVNCDNLEYVNFNANQLTKLDISNWKKIDSVYCNDNRIESLIISGNGNLRWLSCSNNQLTSLDASGCIKLEGLTIENNKVTELNLRNCKAMFYLECEDNQLQTLDISSCLSLLSFVKEENQYKSESYIAYAGSVLDEVSEEYLRFDSNVELITSVTSSISMPTNNTTTVSTPSPANPAAPAPAAPATPTISAIRKSSKTTIYAAPWSVYQLDLGGATGKSFKSSKKKVATVDANGLVTVKKAGKTKITFKVGKKKRTVTLTVKDPTIPTSIALNLAGTVAAKVGEPQTLTVTLPEGTTSGIKWKSSNKKVATVSNGVVTFKKKGKVTITATATRGKKKAKVKFVVSR